MKRIFFLLLVSGLWIALFAGNSAHAQTAKPIQLKLSSFLSTMHELHDGLYVPFTKEVEEKTKGRVKITYYPGEALGKAKDQYDLAARGMADIAVAMQGYTPGRFPLSGVIELPLNIPSARVASMVFQQLYEKHLKAEYPGVKVLWMYTTDPAHFMMGKKAVKSIEDLKGLRLRSPGPDMTLLLKELGISPVNMPVVEVYESIQRGLLDGAVTNFTGLRSFKLFEVVRHSTIANFGTLPCVVVMNQKAWDSLPKDIQKIIDEIVGMRMAEKAGMVFDRYVAIGKDLEKKAGGQIFEFPPEQMKMLNDRCKAFNEKWVSQMEAKGLPGKKIFAEANALIEKYSK